MQTPHGSIWRNDKHIVGMVHLLALPGSPGYRGSMQEIIDRAARDAESLVAGGVDGIIVENYGDVPFFPDAVPAATVSALSIAVLEVLRLTDIPVGVNVLRNDAAAAMSIATCTGAAFIRVNVHTGAMLTDQGWIAGRAHETLRLRPALQSNVRVYADVIVKHAVAPQGLTLEDAARDAFHRGGADALIVSGTATGAPTDVTDANRVKTAVPTADVWIGSGVTADSVVQMLDTADGVIVGSAFEEGGVAGRPVELDRVRKLIDVARSRHT